MKQKLLLFLAILCNASFLIATNYSGSCGEKLHWELNTEDSTLAITGSGAMKNWDYSSTIPWYQYRSYVVKVSLPSNLTTIGDRAFTQCSALREINIPLYVTSIGNYSFSSCSSLTSVILPNKVVSLGMSAFAGCVSLQAINIPNSVTSIGQSAFYNCSSLEGIVIPKSVTSISTSAFSSCLAMTSIQVDAQNPAYCSLDGVLFDKTGATLLQYPAGKTDILYDIPTSVTTIGNFSFHKAAILKSVKIPDNVITIGQNVFSLSQALTEVNIGSGVSSIGSDAFRECHTLSAINVDELNSKYSSTNGVLYTKAGTTLILYPISNPTTAYIIPDSIVSIAEGGFDRCIHLTSLTSEPQTPPTLLGGVFYGVDKSIPLYVPSESISAYKSAEQWKDFMNILPIQNTITNIDTDAITCFEHSCSKELRNDQLLILRDGKTYTIQGQEVR